MALSECGSFPTSVIVVDDEKSFPFPDDWDVWYSRTLKAATLKLRWMMDFQKPFDQLWLDHDLGGEDTIRPLVRWLETEAHYGKFLQVELIVVCSLNASGADWIADTLSKDYLVTRCTDPAKVGELCGTSEGTVWYV